MTAPARGLGRLALFIGGFAACAAIAAGSAENAEFPVKDLPEAREYRGHIVFENYCQKCHGVTGDGNGRAAKLYDPRPANLIKSDKNDSYKELIIRRGGAAMARSEFMPPWQDELTDEQIADVVGYLRSIAERKID